mmetsp:Transcript_42814/g.132244  ORF Transcript_42814/g.132244 Transcript_42814/m.132244 type:complete len:236 (-) Transcript_42814:67-774(-)
MGREGALCWWRGSFQGRGLAELLLWLLQYAVAAETALNACGSQRLPVQRLDGALRRRGVLEESKTVSAPDLRHTRPRVEHPARLHLAELAQQRRQVRVRERQRQSADVHVAGLDGGVGRAALGRVQRAHAVRIGRQRDATLRWPLATGGAIQAAARDGPAEATPQARRRRRLGRRWQRDVADSIDDGGERRRGGGVLLVVRHRVGARGGFGGRETRTRWSESEGLRSFVRVRRKQ